MPYVAKHHPRQVDHEAMRARIPGWGSDLDRADRPSGVKERTDLNSGAHWTLPELQEGSAGREMSIEHTALPPVFGTSIPLKGLSGAIRRFAYVRYGEGRAAHWLLLILGDRVDAIESHLVSLATFRPDQPITQTGVLSEPSRRPLRSRFGLGRADLRHIWIDPILVAGPWVLAAGVAVSVIRRIRRR